MLSVMGDSETISIIIKEIKTQTLSNLCASVFVLHKTLGGGKVP